MGFEWEYCAPSEKITKVCKALENFGFYVDTFYPSKYGDFTGLTQYNGPYTNGDEVFSEVWHGNINPVDIESGKAKPTEVILVKDYFKEYLKDLKRGYNILYWHEIAFVPHIHIHLLVALKRACEKHGCLDFFNKLVQSWDNQDAMLDKLTRQISRKLGTELELFGDRKW